MTLTMTRQLAWAIATDAGNASMRINKRAAWNEQDYNCAARRFDELWPDEMPALIDEKAALTFEVERALTERNPKEQPK